MPEVTGNLHGSNLNSLGIAPSSGIMLTRVVEVSQTRPSMGTTATMASSDNVERRKYSVIDISPEAALRLGLARHSAAPFFDAAVTSSSPRFAQIEGSSNPRPPIAHHRAMTLDSFVPPISRIVEKPLPRRPSLAGSSHPLRPLQLPQVLTQPGPPSPRAVFTTSSSLSHSRPESAASLFSFIQNRPSTTHAKNEDTSMPLSVSIPAALAVGYTGHSSGGQAVARKMLKDDNQISTTCTYNAESPNPLIHSDRDARQTLPPPWFESTASISRSHQQTIDIPSRMSHHRAITVPEPLQTTRRYSYHPLSRSLSTATTLTTPPPPPYTPLDTNFEVPPLPQQALLLPSRRLVLAATSPPDDLTLGHPPRQQIPECTPCTSDSKMSLRSRFNQQQVCSIDHGTVLFTRPRSHSLPVQNASMPRGPILTKKQPGVEALRPLQISTGTRMRGPPWFPGTIDEITSITPSRGTFTIDE